MARVTYLSEVDMTRLFVSLLTVLLIAILGYLFGIGGAFTFFTKDIIEEARLGQMSGITKLLDEQLIDLNQQQREEQLKKIQTTFKFKVDLHALNNIPDDVLSPDEKQSLLEKGVAVKDKDDGETNFFLSNINKQMIWELEVTPSTQENDRLFLVGPLSLVNQQLSKLPKKDWQQEVDRISAYFKEPPMQLLTFSKLPSDKLITKKEFKRLQSGESVLIFEDDYNLRYIFNRINQSDQVIKIGPFSYPTVLKNLQIIAFFLFTLLISTVIWLWLLPLWRDLNKLKHASKQFGQGELQTRITLPRYSFISSSLESFNGMADHIEQLISSHKTLTNAVSHELRTPVSRLRFGLEMLTKTESEADKARYTSSMNADIEELDDMLAELLSYARMDRHGINLLKTPLKLNQWLQQQTQYWESYDKNIQIKINTHNLSANKVTCMDEKLMARALHNLLQNAYRYAKHLIEIDFSYSNKKGNEHYTLSVSDDGAGIPEQYHPTIFDPFTRVDDSRDRDSGGYGLGLAIVKQIIKAHNGTVSLECSPLGGAKFILHWSA